MRRVSTTLSLASLASLASLVSLACIGAPFAEPCAARASGEQLMRVWEVSAGGNGHAYETIPLGSAHTFEQASVVAERRGGRIVLPNSALEQAFTVELLAKSGMTRSWIEGVRDPDWRPGLLDPSSTPAAWIRDCASRRTLDLVVIGDSNVLFRATGWDHGLQDALATQGFPCVALGPTPFNHDGGSAGWNWSKYIAPNGVWPEGFGNAATSTENAPAGLARFMDFPGGFPNTGAGYAWLSSGAENVTGGVGIGANHPFITQAADMEFRLQYGTLPDGGSFTPTAWLNQSSERISGAPVFTNSLKERLAEASLTVNGAFAQGVGFRFALDDGSGLVAPLFLAWASVERTDITTGWCVSVLDWHAGASSIGIADDLDGFVGDTASNWVALMRARQLRRDNAPRVLFVLSNGMNDTGVTAAQHEDALRRMIARLESNWIAGGGTSDETAYLLKTSHDPHLTGTAPAFAAFRARARAVAAKRDDAAAADLGSVFMRSEYFPDTNGGAAHLTQLGYERLSSFLIDAALGAEGGACDWQWGGGGVPTAIPWEASYEDGCVQSRAALVVTKKSGGVWRAMPADEKLSELVIEYDRDCDGDGVIDRIAIALGHATDLNGDVIPDICQCMGDLNFDGAVDSADLVMLLGAWGSNAAADLNGSGVVDAADLVQLMGAWGICPPIGGGGSGS